MRIATWLLACALVASLPAHAADFYVDPATGNDANDGSAARPWRSLQAVIDTDKVRTQDWNALPWNATRTLVVVNPAAPVRPGDTIWLRSGDYGDFLLRSAYNTAPVTIAAQPGHVPRFRSVRIEAAQHWILRGLSISRAHGAPATGGWLLTIANHNHYGPVRDVEVAASDLSTAPDASAWGVPEWLGAASGASLGGERNTLRDSRIRNVRHGISAGGTHARVIGNSVDGFSADGMRGLGDYGLFEYNVIRNGYLGSSVDDNHDDGFQSWSVGEGGVGTGEVRGVVLRGNTFINYTDPTNPLRGSLQGIGCFDGFFVGWVVENNVVMTNHWHGITFMGMRDSRIANNTVVDLNTTTPGPPWIQVSAHKDGRPSQDVVVRNNLAMSFTLQGTNITNDRNLAIGNAAAHFVGWPYNLRLKPGAPGIDTGSAVQPPALDVLRTPRPQGLGIDVGAYEACPNGPCPGDGPILREGAAPLRPPVSGTATAAAASTLPGASATQAATPSAAPRHGAARPPAGKTTRAEPRPRQAQR